MFCQLSFRPPWSDREILSTVWYIAYMMSELVGSIATVAPSPLTGMYSQMVVPWPFQRIVPLSCVPPMTRSGLEKLGCRAFYVDLTTPDVADYHLSVVRVLPATDALRVRGRAARGQAPVRDSLPSRLRAGNPYRKGSESLPSSAALKGMT
jgi:hypothetical protein